LATFHFTAALSRVLSYIAGPQEHFHCQHPGSIFAWERTFQPGHVAQVSRTDFPLPSQLTIVLAKQKRIVLVCRRGVSSISLTFMHLLQVIYVLPLALKPRSQPPAKDLLKWHTP